MSYSQWFLCAYLKTIEILLYYNCYRQMNFDGCINYLSLWSLIFCFMIIVLKTKPICSWWLLSMGKNKIWIKFCDSDVWVFHLIKPETFKHHTKNSYFHQATHSNHTANNLHEGAPILKNQKRVTRPNANIYD